MCVWGGGGRSMCHCSGPLRHAAYLNQSFHTLHPRPQKPVAMRRFTKSSAGAKLFTIHRFCLSSISLSKVEQMIRGGECS